MLAKAVATEAGANFINISMSTIASKVICFAHLLSGIIFFCGRFVCLDFLLSCVFGDALDSGLEKLRST